MIKFLYFLMALTGLVFFIGFYWIIIKAKEIACQKCSHYHKCKLNKDNKDFIPPCVWINMDYQNATNNHGK